MIGFCEAGLSLAGASKGEIPWLADYHVIESPPDRDQGRGSGGNGRYLLASKSILEREGITSRSPLFLFIKPLSTPQALLFKIRGSPCAVSGHLLGPRSFEELVEIARRSNRSSRLRSGTLIDWSMSFIQQAPLRFGFYRVAPAPAGRALALAGSNTEERTGSDHLPHAVRSPPSRRPWSALSRLSWPPPPPAVREGAGAPGG